MISQPRRAPGRAARLWSLAFPLSVDGTKDLRRVDRVVAGYRRHLPLESDELSRLAAVARVRPMILETWAHFMRHKGIPDAA